MATGCTVNLRRSDSSFAPPPPPPTQGGSSGPGGRRPPGPAALLSLPGPLPAQLRPERRGARAPAPRGPALRRLRLLAARQRDLAAAAEGPQHGERGEGPVRALHGGRRRFRQSSARRRGFFSRRGKVTGFVLEEIRGTRGGVVSRPSCLNAHDSVRGHRSLQTGTPHPQFRHVMSSCLMACFPK